MEAPGEQPRLLQRPEIRHVLDHTERFRIASRVRADAARVDRVDVAADAAMDHPLVHALQRTQQRRQRGLALLQQVKDRAACRTGAKAGQAGQRLGQGIDLGRGHATN